jgi:alpha/beta superfamily hydrolase
VKQSLSTRFAFFLTFLLTFTPSFCLAQNREILACDGIAINWIAPTARWTANIVSAPVAAILVPGSGPLDRYGNEEGTRTLGNIRDIATMLQTAGIGSLSFDKRGVAKSANSFGRKWYEGSLKDAALDIGCLVHWVKQDQPNVTIVLIGVGDGTLSAMVAARTSDVARLVMVSPPDSFDAIAAATHTLDKDGLSTAGINEVLHAVSTELKSGRANLRHPILRPAVHRLLERVRHLTDPVAQDILLKGLQLPILVVAGGKERDFDAPAYRAFLANSPRLKAVFRPDLDGNLRLRDPSRQPAINESSIPIDGVSWDLIRAFVTCGDLKVGQECRETPLGLSR